METAAVASSRSNHYMRRRDFLATALGFTANASVNPSADVNCILLMLVGGPSHLDTWDLKPEAPSSIRGPFRSIKTTVPGIEISEIFPRMARHADKFSLIRSVHHSEAPVHDIGHQMMQTGRMFLDGFEHPHFGSVLQKIQGNRHVLLPGPIGSTGGNMPHGHGAGYLGESFNPIIPPSNFLFPYESEKTKERYGRTRFGENCLRARQLVESGTRFVTVNMFDTVFDELTWDIHGARPFSPISCYRDTVGPTFDAAYSALLEDLSDRGLLSTTIVVAAGEFGRTPHINASGGRDHWPGCFTVLMGGGPLKCGTVIGSSDKIGAEPKDRPVTPMEIAATIYRGLGIDPATQLNPSMPLIDPGVEPIHELLI